MTDQDLQDTGESTLFADSTYTDPSDIAFVGSDEVLVDSDFQRKFFIILVSWLVVNLLLIKIAWAVYGERLSEIFSGML